VYFVAGGCHGIQPCITPHLKCRAIDKKKYPATPLEALAFQLNATECAVLLTPVSDVATLGVSKRRW